MNFTERYGPWALVAGASEGIGAAFARELSARGLGVVLVARREAPLVTLAAELPGPSRVIVADLSVQDGIRTALEAVEDLTVGLVVANAASVPTGPYTALDQVALERALDLNCRVPVVLARHLLPSMVARKRGGLIVMSSLAGQQGSPGIAVYAGTKAFGAVFAESLWAEMRPHGVAVLACVAGAVRTPGFSSNWTTQVPGTVAPELVVAASLRALGRRPRVVPGVTMRLSSQFMSRLLPRRMAIAILSRASRSLFE
ncbi:SDR family NAD(P)-dependent oxidoreductase [Glycomyces tarimensis]